MSHSKLWKTRCPFAGPNREQEVKWDTWLQGYWPKRSYFYHLEDTAAGSTVSQARMRYVSSLPRCMSQLRRITPAEGRHCRLAIKTPRVAREVVLNTRIRTWEFWREFTDVGISYSSIIIFWGIHIAGKRRLFSFLLRHSAWGQNASLFQLLKIPEGSSATEGCEIARMEQPYPKPQITSALGKSNYVVTIYEDWTSKWVVVGLHSRKGTLLMLTLIPPSTVWRVIK